MPSRRSTLHATAGALAAALAGCLGTTPPGSDRSGTPTDRSGTPSDAPPSNRSTDAIDGPHLTATVVQPPAVPAGAVLAPATAGLLAAVREAATTDGRVDFVPEAGLDREARLVLGEFDYLRFRGTTYAPSAEFVPFAGETSYEYSAERVPESEVADADEVVGYANLTDAERAIADRLVAGEAYEVGMHEPRPDALDVFDVHRYLRTGNATYAVRILHGDSAAHHALRLDPADPGPDATVVTVADRAVPEGVRDVVTSAVAEGAAAVDGDERETLAGLLADVGYVVTVERVARLELRDGDGSVTLVATG